jgi:hypothetical protein
MARIVLLLNVRTLAVALKKQGFGGWFQRVRVIRFVGFDEACDTLFRRNLRGRRSFSSRAVKADRLVVASFRQYLSV